MQRLGVFIFLKSWGPKQRSTVGGHGDEIRIRDDEPNRISWFMSAKGIVSVAKEITTIERVI